MKRKKSAGKKHIHLVKRAGHFELFDERKLYASIYAACRANHYGEKQAELVTEAVTKEIVIWIDEKERVTSDQIFRLAGKLLEDYDKKVAFLYLHHLDVS